MALQIRPFVVLINAVTVHVGTKPNSPANRLVGTLGTVLLTRLILRDTLASVRVPSVLDTSVSPTLVQIMAGLRHRYASLNRHYEAAWTDSWCHRRCLHTHKTLIEASKCAMPHGAGW